MADVISSLKRLERAGAEDSRATQKLCQAADVLAEHIIVLLPGGTWGENNLPRGWSHDGRYLVAPRYEIEPGDSVAGIDAEGVGGADRQSALWLAEAIATGWLDELAEWLEAKGAESEAATQRILAAVAALG